MEKYNEIIKPALIDFEEIKFILANNNINLITSKEIREKYYLKNDISLKTAKYQTIIDNSYILINVNETKSYLSYKKQYGNEKEVSLISIEEEKECIDFLNHAGYKEAFTIEKNVYEYENDSNKLEIVNLIGIGLYLSMKSNDESVEKLNEIMTTFNIPYDESEDVVFEKLVINKVRRYM